jgi:hypothetical protein
MQRMKNIIIVALASIAMMGAGNDCDASKQKGKANEAAYAGDGVTQFVDGAGRACANDTAFCANGGSGKLRFGKGYKAVAVDTTDRQNCKWRLYTFNQQGKTTVIKEGGYFTANIRVERPNRVKVYLKSEECGDWKPTS